ncbi:MAG: ABC transporter permease [Proteobacteria bacterium]|nr:ABC transporter permease [Pseudomonadota bacterium]
MSPGTPDRSSDHPSYWEIVGLQFRKRRASYVAAWCLVGLILVAILAPAIACNKPFLWRQGDGSVSSPWLEALFDRNFFESSLDLFFNSVLFPGSVFLVPLALLWRRAGIHELRVRRRRRLRILLTGAALWTLAFVVVLLVAGSKPKQIYPVLQQRLEAQGTSVLALYPPLPYSFRDVDLGRVRSSASFEHPLGTDNAGRDVLARLLYGTRISLAVGLFAVLLYITIGTVIGALAGYCGGRTDAVLLRLIEVVMSIPAVFLVLTVAAFIEHRSIFHIVLVIAAVSWTTPARLVRAEFLRLRNLDFVVAARASGFGEAAIIVKHILPNALGPVLVSATFGIASAILIEATMSFLGLSDVTAPSWGQILNAGRTSGRWLLILAPGMAIFVTVGLLNMVGEGLRDALDPSLRR